MKLISIFVLVFSIIPCLALNTDCLIQPIKQCELKTSSQIIPLNIFLSPSEKLNIQIEFKGLDLSWHNDHLVISSDECLVHRMRDRAIKTELLTCSDISEGWHQANISITPTVLGIGNFLNYSLDHQISYFVATANYAIYCQESLPTWNIKESFPITIPLRGQAIVDLILESDEEFSPILHLMGNSLSLSWWKESIAISEGPALPKGQYEISIYNTSEQIILTVSPSGCNCSASLTNLGRSLEELIISSTKGTFYSILNLENKNKIRSMRETSFNGSTHDGKSNNTIFIVLISVFGCITLATIIACMYIVQKNKKSMRNKKKDFEQHSLVNSTDNRYSENLNKRIKVDIKEITDKYCQLKDTKNNSIKKYELKMRKDHHDSEKKVQKLSLEQLTSYVPTKTILILGETGSGKSTTINTMVNHIFGIELEDKERLLLIENDTEINKDKYNSQTEFMTAYVFPFRDGMPNKCNYIIIDTPGFGDTQGFEKDKEKMLQLENFLKQDYNISLVDAVGLVVKANTPRLTIAQRYIYDGLFSMFGKDISDNIFLLVTFAGPETEPPVLKVLKDAEMKYYEYFKLNNDSLYRTYNEHGESKELNFNNLERIKFNWNMTEKSLRKLFEKITTINPVSLTLTKVVLEENTRLRSVVGYLQKQITEGLDKLTQLKTKQIESTKSEDTKLIEQDISHTEELLVNSIKEAQQLTERLKEIPLRLDPLSVHGYIELLIGNEKKEMQPNHEERIQVLEKLKEENNVLKAVINKEQSPGESWLHYFQKLKEE